MAHPRAPGAPTPFLWQIPAVADSSGEGGWVTSRLRWTRLVHGPATGPSAGLRLAVCGSTGKLPEPPPGLAEM